MIKLINHVSLKSTRKQKHKDKNAHICDNNDKNDFLAFFQVFFNNRPTNSNNIIYDTL